MSKIIWSIKFSPDSIEYLRKIQLNEFQPEVVSASFDLKIDGEEYWKIIDPKVRESLLYWRDPLKFIPVFEFINGMKNAVIKFTTLNMNYIEWEITSIPFGFGIKKIDDTIILGFIEFPLGYGEGTFHKIATISHLELIKSTILFIEIFINSVLSLNKTLENSVEIKELHISLGTLKKN